MFIASYFHSRKLIAGPFSARCSAATAAITRRFSATFRTASFTRRSSRSWLAFATGLKVVHFDMTSGFRRNAAASLTPTRRFDTRGSLRGQLALCSRLVGFLARTTSSCRCDAGISLVSTRFDTASSACSDTWGSFRHWGSILFSVLDDTWSAALRTAFRYA